MFISYLRRSLILFFVSVSIGSVNINHNLFCDVIRVYVIFFFDTILILHDVHQVGQIKCVCDFLFWVDRTVECMRFRPTYDFPRMKSPKNGTIFFFFFFDHTWKPYVGQKSTHAWEFFLSGENVPLTWLKNRTTYGFHVSLKI